MAGRWTQSELETLRTEYLENGTPLSKLRRLLTGRTEKAIDAMLDVRQWRRAPAAPSGTLARAVVVQGNMSRPLLRAMRVVLEGTPGQQPKGCRFIKHGPRLADPALEARAPAGDIYARGWRFCQAPTLPGRSWCAACKVRVFDADATKRSTRNAFRNHRASARGAGGGAAA